MLLQCTDISWILQRIEIHGEGKKVKISQRECISTASQTSGFHWLQASSGWLAFLGREVEGRKRKKLKIGRFLSFINAALDCMFSLFPFLHTLKKKKYLLNKIKINQTFVKIMASTQIPAPWYLYLGCFRLFWRDMLKEEGLFWEGISVRWIHCAKIFTFTYYCLKK